MLAEKLERFSVPEPNSGCLIWLGGISSKGYGQVWDGERLRGAHVVSYELAKGPIPEGLVPDHKCRIRCCINADHMEAVTQSVNVLRGLRRTGQRTFVCVECGGPYEILSHSKEGYPLRGCRPCTNKRHRQWRQEHASTVYR